MAYTPRKKRLPPEKVRANLVAQEKRLQRRRGDDGTRDKLEGALSGALVDFCTKIHVGVQAAAESNPLYRPLVGPGWVETIKLFSGYAESLKAAGQAEAAEQAWADIGLSNSDAMPLLLLMFALDSRRGSRKPGKSAA